MINETKDLVHLLKELIKIRIKTVGFDNDFTFNYKKIESKNIPTAYRLEELLNHLKINNTKDNSKIKVIENYSIDELMPPNITILGSSRSNLEDFLKRTIDTSTESKKIKKTKNQQIIPLDLPPNMEIGWDNIAITFINGHDVKITIIKDGQSWSHNKSYGSMGFYNNKTTNPNNQWKLLIKLAEEHGKIAWGSTGASNNLKKQKQLLDDGLKLFFNINDSAFGNYRKDKTYHIKIELNPEPSSREYLDI